MTPLGVELRSIRAALGMSLKEFAARIDVTPSYMSALEHGHRGTPTDEMMQRIIAALPISREKAEHLMSLALISRPKVQIETAALEPEATELANRLADNIHTLSKDNLTELLWRVQDMLTHRNGL